MNDIEKLRVLLPHWIAHNKGHGEEFERWIETLEKAGESKLADALKKAAESARQVTQDLEKTLEIAGGPLDTDHSSHHHHHHHHEEKI